MSVSEPQQLAEQLEASRAQLGRTVEELAHRLDVKARASEKLTETRANVAAEVDSLRQTARKNGTVAWERAHRAWQRAEVRRAAVAALVVGALLLRRCRG